LKRQIREFPESISLWLLARWW